MWPFKSVSSAIRFDTESADLSDIRGRLELYSQLLARDGSRVTPYLDAALPVIQARSPELRKLSHGLLGVAVAAHEETGGSDENARTQQYFWRAIRHLGLTPTSDLFDRFSDGNVVEIYSLDHVQLYRNPRFFDFAPITLEEAVGMNWTQQTSRDMKLSLKAMSIAARMGLGMIRDTVDLREALPKHRAYWKDRPGLPVIEIEVLWGSPLTKNGQVVAYALVNRCAVVT